MLVTRSNVGAARANASGIASKRCAKLFGLTSARADTMKYGSMRGTTAAAFAQNTCGIHTHRHTRRLDARVDCHARGRVLISKRRMRGARNKFVSAARPAAAINCASWRDVARAQTLPPESMVAAISPARKWLPFGPASSNTKYNSVLET